MGLLVLILVQGCTKDDFVQLQEDSQQDDKPELKAIKLNVNASAVHSSGSTSTKTKFYFADVTGDGRADKIYWKYDKYSGNIRVFPATGSGNFSSTAIQSSGSSSTKTKFYFADVTGDGKADKIYWKYDKYSGNIRVFPATGGGNFSATATNSSGSSASDTKFYFADVSGNGKADKIYWKYNKYGGAIRVFLSTTINPGGFWNNFATNSINSAGDTSSSTWITFYFADVNGDNKADKIKWDRFESNLDNTLVSLSVGNGLFNVGGFYTLGSESENTNFYFADVNADSRADKIYWNHGRYGGDVRYFQANYGGVFSTNPIQGPGSSSKVTKHYFADVDGNGSDDRIYWKYNKYGGDIRVFRN